MISAILNTGQDPARAAPTQHSKLQRSKVGFPIRKFTDQSLFAAPHDLSQRTTSFFASQRQGIHRILLRHLIALINRCPSAFLKFSSKTHDLIQKASATFWDHARGRSFHSQRICRPDLFIKTSLLQTHPGAKRSSSLTTGCSAFGDNRPAAFPRGNPMSAKANRMHFLFTMEI